MSDQAKDQRASEAVEDRRRFLRRAATVGGAVWVVPSIITVDVASANGVTSPPPKPPTQVKGAVVVPEPSIGDPSIAANVDPATAANGDPSTGASVAGRSELPRTGADLDDIAIAGLAATAGGAALRLWGRTVEP